MNNAGFTKERHAGITELSPNYGRSNENNDVFGNKTKPI